MYVFILSATAFVALLLLAAYRYREIVLPYMPRAIRSRLEVYAPLPSFDDAAAAGFSSATFDLADNEGGARIPGEAWLSAQIRGPGSIRLGSIRSGASCLACVGVLRDASEARSTTSRSTKLD